MIRRPVIVGRKIRSSAGTSSGGSFLAIKAMDPSLCLTRPSMTLSGNIDTTGGGRNGEGSFKRDVYGEPGDDHLAHYYRPASIFTREVGPIQKHVHYSEIYGQKEGTRFTPMSINP